MREILFKAKRFDTKEWIEGYFVQQKNNLGGIHSCIFQNLEEENRWEMKRVHLNTVCQYTGLTDKNGRKIFVGDIVKIGLEHYEVWWNCDSSSITLSSKNESRGLYLSRNETVEVIGNIFDNPELIGERP